jgi:hypothetical protein
VLVAKFGNVEISKNFINTFKRHFTTTRILTTINNISKDKHSTSVSVETKILRIFQRDLLEVNCYDNRT